MKHIRLVLLLVFLATGGTLFFQGCDTAEYSGQTISYEELRALIHEGALIDPTTTIVDVRSRETWAAGSIQDAVNIVSGSIVDAFGNLIDNGEALTSMVADKEAQLIVYGSGDGEAVQVAHQAGELGYQDVYLYEGGAADWELNGDYFVMAYEGFRAWYDEHCPFDDGENYLVSLMFPDFYTGTFSANPDGHIPGAVNMWDELFVSGDSLLDNGKALTDIIPDTDATIVMYCYYAACPRSYHAAQGAVSLGYKHIYRYQDGWVGWQEAGNSFVTGEQPGTCP